MIWLLNLITLILSTLGLAYFYGYSVQPFCKSAKLHDSAFKKCADYRLISGIFEFTIMLNYIVFFIYPIPRIPDLFNEISYAYLLGSILFISGLILLFMAIKAAGKETMKPNEKTEMFKGIYLFIRHPQTLGTLIVWFGIAIASNRLFLLLYTIILSLIYIYITYVEESDLIMKYGEDYLKYREKTGRFFPKIKK